MASYSAAIRRKDATSVWSVSVSAKRRHLAASSRRRSVSAEKSAIPKGWRNSVRAQTRISTDQAVNRGPLTTGRALLPSASVQITACSATLRRSLAYSFGAQGGWRMPGDQVAFFERIRAEERMRIAQYLHDSALQKLALLQLTFGRMRREGFGCLEANLAECEEMVAEIGRQMRHIEAAGFPKARKPPRRLHR